MQKRGHKGCWSCLQAYGHYLLRSLTGMERSIDDGGSFYWWPYHPETED